MLACIKNSIMASQGAQQRKAQIDVERIREDFPMLKSRINGKQLIYLDSAATSHKPQVVLDRLIKFYTKEYAKPEENHSLSKKVTDNYEEVREKTAKFLNAGSKEIVFTMGTTEAINLVAAGFEREILKEGDEVLITEMEHDSNMLPWQMACAVTGAKLKVVPVNEAGEIMLERMKQMINERTKIISVSHSSHVLGTVNPIKEIVKIAKQHNVPVFVDGAQTAPHMPVDVKDMDCDFFAFSGHKMGSPSGVGVLYGKKKWLEKLPPFLEGEDMAKTVSFEKSTFKSPPDKFEGGSLPFAEIISFGTLIDYVNDIGMQPISEYEKDLLAYAELQLASFDRIKIVGAAKEKEPLVSIMIEGSKPSKLGQFLNDEYNIASRAGALSAEPLLKNYGTKELLRFSFTYYNTYQEIDILAEAVERFLKKH
jgi:cysteine desulfurase/selenocysteine lyase